MKYKSTRNRELRVSAAQAIMQGLSEDGGLFVPEVFPEIEMEDIECLAQKPYTERAIEILSLFLTDFSDEQLVSCVENAYTEKKFGSDSIIRVEELREGVNMLELWHGPTCRIYLQLRLKFLGIKRKSLFWLRHLGIPGKQRLLVFKMFQARVSPFFTQRMA